MSEKLLNQTILIKFGGAAMKDSSLSMALFSQIALLCDKGIKVVMVHGGGPEIDKLLGQLNIEVKKVDGLRVTDSQTLEVVEMVLAGKVNKLLVSEAAANGLSAVGISAIDGQIAQIEARDLRLGFVGKVLSVDIKLISCIQEAGFFPIICSVGQDRSGQHYNINADELAAALAGALQVDLFLLITDVPGLMRAYPDPTTLVAKVSAQEIDQLRSCGAISSGMLPKVEACLNAVSQGAKASLISDNLHSDIISYLLSGQSPKGTLFV